MSYVSYDGSAFLGGKVKGREIKEPKRCVEYVAKRKATKPPTEKQLMAREKIAMAGKLRKENPALTPKQAYVRANDMSEHGVASLFGSAYLGGKVKGREIKEPKRCIEYVAKRKATKPPTEKQLMAREKIAMAGKLRKENPALTPKQAYVRANDMSEHNIASLFGSAYPRRIGLAYSGKAYLGGGLLSNIVRENHEDGLKHSPRVSMGYQGNPDILRALHLRGGCMDCQGRCGMGI